MIDSPTLLFLWILVGALAGLAVLLPEQGLLDRWQAYRSGRQRQQVEDALKVLFHARQEGRTVTLNEIEESLRLPFRKVLDMVARMQADHLLTPGDRLELTPEGELLALQIIRAHRLWERYLADEARMPLEAIHRLAHKREHAVTLAEINAMDAALGYPASDPHGDPIPTSEGMLRVQQESAPIATLNRGERGKIVHLEDEPPVAYAQLLAEGLHIGQTVSIIETSAARIVFSNGEREVALAPGIAANVFVQQLEQTRTRQEGVLPLSKLKSKESAEVIELDERCQGFTRRRFLDLGLTPGTTIAVELDNAFREPRAYRVRSTLIALRKEQADLIWVRPDAGDGKA